MQKTRVIKKADNQPHWYLIDAQGMNLGKLSVKAASLLLGKGKVTYTSHLFSGDNVIVINAKGIKVNEKKGEGKMYHRHSGFPGGLHTLNFNQLLVKNPSVIIKKSVKGMIPKTKLGDEIITHLYVYNDEKNPHEAQQPITLS